MKIAAVVIVGSLLAAAVGGAFVLEGGEYAVYLFALAVVTFFGSLPVVFGVLTRPRAGCGGRGAEAEDVVIIRDAAHGDVAKSGAGGGSGAAAGVRTGTPRAP